MLTRLRFLLRETGLGLRRGGWMNGAAITTITVLLFLLGIGLQSTWQLDRVLNQFGNQLEVSVFLDSGVAAKTLQPIVEQFQGVAAVTSVPKEVAWTELAKDLQLPNPQAALAQLGGNPLVDELRVKAQNPTVVTALVEQLRQLRGVDEVQYLSEILVRLQQLNQGLQTLGLAIVSLLTFTGLTVIMMTIRLIIMARRTDIELMQLVGATSTSIFLPFLFQGLLFGIIGAAIAWAFLLTTQLFIGNLVSGKPDLLTSLARELQLNPLQQVQLPLILFTFGGLVGALGSLLALKPFVGRE